MQNYITAELTSRGKDRFIFLDADSVVGLLNQETERLALGGKDNNTLKKIVEATQSEEIILSEVKKEEGKYVITIKHVSSQPYAILSNITLDFYFYQIPYYAAEIAKKILNTNYKINYKKAPTLSDSRIQVEKLNLSKVILSALKLDFIPQKKRMILKESDYKNDDRLSQFIKAMQGYIEQADNLYKQKNYLESAQIYEKILEAVQTLSEKDQEKLKKDIYNLKERIEHSYSQHYLKEMKKIDEIYQSKEYFVASAKYKNIYEQIDKNKMIESENRLKLLEIVEKRREISFQEGTNQQFLQQIKTLDNQIQREKQISLFQLEQFALQYEKLLENYNKTENFEQQPEITKGLKNRIDSLLEQISQKLEQKGDDYLGLYDFKQAEQQYQLATEKIQKLYSNQLRNKRQERINKKQQKNRVLGENYYRNQILTYSSIATTEKAMYILEKSMKNQSKARKHYNNTMRSLKKARTILKKLDSSWIEEDGIKTYNRMILAINRDLKKNYQTYPFQDAILSDSFQLDRNRFSIGFSVVCGQTELIVNKFYLSYFCNRQAIQSSSVEINRNEKTLFASHHLSLNSHHIAFGWTFHFWNLNFIPKINYENYKIRFNKDKIYPKGKYPDKEELFFTELIEQKSTILEKLTAEHILNSNFVGFQIEKEITNDFSIYGKYDSAPKLKTSVAMTQISLQDNFNFYGFQADFSFQMQRQAIGVRKNRWYMEVQQQRISTLYEIQTIISSNPMDTDELIEDLIMNKYNYNAKVFTEFFIGMSFNF